MSMLLDYIYNWRLYKLFDNYMANAYDGDAAICPHCDLKWEVQKCAVPVLSDMFWIRPAHEASHLDLLSYLGSRDFAINLPSLIFTAEAG